jgi:hypothetical protein
MNHVVVNPSYGRGVWARIALKNLVQFNFERHYTSEYGEPVVYIRVPGSDLWPPEKADEFARELAWSRPLPDYR